MKKRVFKAVCATVFALSCVMSASLYAFGESQSAPVQKDIPTVVAEAETVYNLNELPVFSDRTMEDVVEEYDKAIAAGGDYVDGDSSTYYEIAASTKSPYHQGVITTDTAEAMRAMTDFYRWLVGGVDPLESPCKNEDYMQYQALDRNFQFDHYISQDSKPADMDDALWQLGFKVDHNIIAMGYTPRGAITGWMNEGYNLRNHSWDTLGHRYALINPVHTELNFGYSGRVAIGKYTANNSSKTAQGGFYAFPSPGYMPSELVSAYESAWSVDFAASVLKIDSACYNNVVVTIKNLNTGTTYTRQKSDSTISVSSGSISFAQPEDYTNNRYTDPYEITITGIVDATTGKEVKIEYTTEFFDVLEYAASKVRSATWVEFNGIAVDESATAEYLNKIAAILPDELTVTAESGYKYTAAVKGAWKLDEENKCWVNSIDVSELPSNISDPDNVLDRVTISYYSDPYSRYSYMRLDPTSPEEGQTGYLRVNRYISNYNGSRVYKLIENNDGTYSAELKFTDDMRDTDKEGSYDNGHYYKFDKFAVEDSGEYISIYYSTSWTSYAYVSTSSVTINITHDLKDVRVEPTCTKEGSITPTCKVCGYKDKENVTVLKKKPHDYDVTVVAATCTKDGSETKKCKNCDDTVVTKIEALTHDIKTETVDSTCTEEGYIRHYCTRGDYGDITAIAMKEHSWDDGKVTKKPTCTAKGVLTRTCKVCKKATKPEDIDALGHDYIDDVIKPTCQTEGYTHRTCSRCDIDEKLDIKETIPHNYEDVRVEPTCIAKGSITPTCAMCGDEDKDNVTILDTVDHKYEDVTVDATCTEDGSITTKCVNCGDVADVEVIPSEGHKPILVGEKEVGIYEDGYTGDTVCDVCGEVLEKGEIIPKIAGDIVIDAQSGENAPDVTVSEDDLNSLEDAITTDDREKLESGSDIDIILRVENADDTVSGEIKSAVQASLGDEYMIGKYLSIDISKYIDSVFDSFITDIDSPIAVTLTIPDDLKSAGRTFFVVRVHGDKIEILSDEDADADTVTFSSDKFSIYAIAYQDAAEPPADDNNDPETPADDDNKPETPADDNNDSETSGSDDTTGNTNDDSSKKPASDSNPQTGVAASATATAALFLAIAAFAVKRKTDK